MSGDTPNPPETRGGTNVFVDAPTSGANATLEELAASMDHPVRRGIEVPEALAALGLDPSLSVEELTRLLRMGSAVEAERHWHCSRPELAESRLEAEVHNELLDRLLAAGVSK